MTLDGQAGQTIKPIHWATLALVGLLACAAYGQMYWHDFIYFDDDGYVFKNPNVITGLNTENFLWALTSIDLANWHPITFWSHQLDSTLFGDNAGAHRLSNLLLHLACIGLVFETFRRITRSAWTGLFIAAVFGLHPVNVEVVAWVSQRKTLLSTIFTLLSVLAYLRYVAAPSLSRYGLILFWLVLGLMSKPMAVTTPLLFLILDFWPLNRLKGYVDLSSPDALRPHDPSKPVTILQSSNAIIPPLDIKSIPRLFAEKIPMLLVVGLVAGLTLVAQKRATSSLELVTPLDRVANACQAYVQYLKTAVWPVDLAILYPLAKPEPLPSLLALAFLLSASALIVRQATGLPFLVTGWLWYIVSLVPVIGLVQVGSQSHADRYAYTPLLGIWLIVGMGLPMLVRGRLWNYRVILATAAVAFVCALSWGTFVQVGYWKNTKILFKHALDTTDRNHTAYTQYATALFEEKNYSEASLFFSKSLEINGNQPKAYSLYATSLMRMGRPDLAHKVIQDSLKLHPDQPDSLYVQAQLHQQTGRPDLALAAINRHLQVAKPTAPALQLQGLLLFSSGRFEDALNPLSASRALAPENADTAYLLAMTLLQLNRPTEALPHLQFAAARRKDRYSRLNLGLLFNQLQQPDHAAPVLTGLVGEHPDFTPARLALAHSLLALGDKAGARRHAQTVLQKNPQDPQAKALIELTDKTP